MEAETETAADLAYLLKRGTSLGGMRPKCTAIDADGYSAIGKFPSITDQRAVTKAEVLALTLARAAVIQAAEAQLVESAGAPVALILRFDRLPGGRRLMYASAATLVGSDDGREHAYTEIVDAIRQHGAPTRKRISMNFGGASPSLSSSPTWTITCITKASCTQAMASGGWPRPLI